LKTNLNLTKIKLNSISLEDDEEPKLSSPQSSSLPKPKASSGARQRRSNVSSSGDTKSAGNGEFVSSGNGNSNSGNFSESKSRTELDVPQPRGNKARNRSVRSRNHRAVSYAESNNGNSPVSETTEKQRSQVDLAAVEAVRIHEEMFRSPTVMDHFNEGYDVESCAKSGDDVERYIEVKGLSGAWNEFGVKLTPAQIRFGIEKGEAHWLYVVEFALDPKRQVIHKIQNPVEKVTDYRFDSGWKQFCSESIGNGNRIPEEGGRVEIEELGIGTVTKLKPFGDAMRLTIRLDNGQEKKMNFPSNKITVVD